MSTSSQHVDAFDEGFDAFNDGKDKEDNPYDPADEEWEEWNDGWDRGESDDGQRMNEYCCGGADWPWYDFKTTVLVNGKNRRAIIRYEWVDNSEVVLGYKCGHKNVESVKLKARKDVSNIEQAVYRRIQSDGR